MRNFYLLLIILSGGYLTVQAVAWIFYHKMFFPDAGELFEDKSDKTLWQTVFPKNMLRLIICVFTASVIGILCDTAGMAGWITMPIGVVGALVINFIISKLFEPIYDKAHKSGEPNSEELEGLTARVIEDIDPESFGVIDIKHGSKTYLFRAVSANNRYLPKGKSVIVIYAQDGYCFVESEEHFCDVLFEE